MDRNGFLVLGRREGQDVQIGEQVIVRVVRIKGGTVRLAILAPRDIPVRRSEARRNEAA